MSRLDVDALLQHPERVSEIPPEQLPALLAQLAAIQGAIAAKMRSLDGAARALDERDQLVDIEEAARRLAISKDYLYRNSANLPFTVRMGRRLLFSAKGIERFICQRQKG